MNQEQDRRARDVGDGRGVTATVVRDDLLDVSRSATTTILAVRSPVDLKVCHGCGVDCRGQGRSDCP